MMRVEIYMMGFRRTDIPGVTEALNRRGLEGAITYSTKETIMILHKDRTVCFAKYPLSVKEWVDQGIKFVDYVYDELDPLNWD